MVKIVSVKNNQSASVPRDRWWECVTLENDGSNVVNLEGWYIYGSRDESSPEFIDYGIKKYQEDGDDVLLPNKSIYPGEQFFIYSGPAAYLVQKLMDQDKTNSYVTSQKLIWSDKGETLKLIKKKYKEESEFSYGDTVVDFEPIDGLDGTTFLFENSNESKKNLSCTTMGKSISNHIKCGCKKASDNFNYYLDKIKNLKLSVN